MTPSGPPFVDVQALLDSSRPKQRVNWFWYSVGIFLLISLGAAYISASSPTGKMIVEGGSVFFTIGLITVMSMVTAFTVRKVRASQMQIEAAAELVQLRRWPQAGALLTQILSCPERLETGPLNNRQTPNRCSESVRAGRPGGPAGATSLRRCSC